MTVDRLREVHKAVLFRRFKLYLADGGTIAVFHPESLAYSQTGRTIIVIGPDDSTQFIDSLLASRIELDNGAKRPRRRR